MDAGDEGSPPLSEAKRYNGVVVQLRDGKNIVKELGRRRKNAELRRDDAGEQEPLIFASEQSLPGAKVGMKVSFNVRPWKSPGPWDYGAVDIKMHGHVSEEETNANPEMGVKKPSPYDLLKAFADEKLDHYRVGDGPIEDGREFKGRFIEPKKGIFVAGWQSHIECDELGLVFAQQPECFEGSLKLGAEVRFKAVASKDNRGERQWKAIDWKSSFKRPSLPEPPLRVEYLEIGDRVAEIDAWLDANNDPVLAVAKMTAKDSREVRRRKLEKKISENLPGYRTTEFNWPENSHKMIHEHVACSVLIHRSELEEPVMECHSGNRRPREWCWNCLSCRLKIGVAQTAYERQVVVQSSQWVILGDETGTLREFSNESERGSRKSRMLWVVVPPNSNLPPLHPLFHASDPEWFSADTLEALETLTNKRNRVKSFVFSHEEGKLPKKLGKNTGPAKVDLLLFWQFTLPLVMEYVVSEASEGDSVCIYVERKGGEGELPPGGEPLAPVVQEFVDLYSRRERPSGISWKETRVLEKYPGEHAWLGYCDAIGFIYGDNIEEEFRAPIQKFRETCVEAPFRQTSLNSGIRKLLKTTDEPLVFLKSLSDIPLDDMRDYVIPFLSSAVSDCVSALNKGQWQDLLEHMKHTSKDKKGQNATNLIYRHVAIPEVLDLLTRPADRFDFLLAMLGTANHVGSVRSALECRGHLDDMIEKGYKPPPERKKKMENLIIGGDDNIFDFRHIDESLWMRKFPEDVNDVDEEYARFYGAQAQSRALRDRDDDFTQAWAIEKYLKLRAEKQENETHVLRRWVIRAELLLMEPRRAEEALVALTGSETGEGGLPGLVSDSIGKLLEDQYYLAAILKSCALLAKGEDEFEKYTATVISRLNHDHPSQRIAYWCARWADEIGLKENRVSKECLRHIVKMTDIEANFPEVTKGKLTNFGRDAEGVILACELLDLEKSRGLIDFDSQAFLDRVLSDSHEKTREWVEAHWPDEEDWLRPLNFNYR